MMRCRRAAVVAGMLMPALLVAVGGARADSLYTALGEQPGLVRIVDAAAARWVHDERVAAVFADTNIARFKPLAVDHLCALTGGPCEYRGRSMVAAHKGLHIDARQFDAVAQDLQAAMSAEGVPPPVQDRLLELLAPMQADVVTR